LPQAIDPEERARIDYEQVEQQTPDRIRVEEQRAQQLTVFVSEFERGAIRLGVVLNAGGILTSLTFYGNLLSRSDSHVNLSVIDKMWWSILFWIFGLLIASSGGYLAYLSQREFRKARYRKIDSIIVDPSDQKQNKEQSIRDAKLHDCNGRKYLSLFNWFIALSLIVFSIACLIAMSGLAHL
jgi:hypothetical protein